MMIAALISSFAGIPRFHIGTVIQRGRMVDSFEARVTQLGALLLASATAQERRLFGLVIRGLIPAVYARPELIPLAYPYDVTPPDVCLRVAAILRAVLDPPSAVAPFPMVSDQMQQRITGLLERLFLIMREPPAEAVKTIVDAARNDRDVPRRLVDSVLSNPTLLEACVRTLWYQLGWVPPMFVTALNAEQAARMVECGVIIPQLVAAAATTPMTAARVVCAGITSSNLTAMVRQDQRATALTVTHRPDLAPYGEVPAIATRSKGGDDIYRP